MATSTFELHRLAAQRWVIVSILAAWFTTAPAAAQPGPSPGPRGGPAAGSMATRSVSKYLGFERALQHGLVDRNRGAVKALLADDFELRTATSPDVVGADDWLRHELASPAHDYLVRDLAVRELEDIAVVSFLLEPAQTESRSRAVLTMFVVDVWKQSSSKLISRYIAAPAIPPARRSRPSGRE